MPGFGRFYMARLFGASLIGIVHISSLFVAIFMAPPFRPPVDVKVGVTVWWSLMSVFEFSKPFAAIF